MQQRKKATETDRHKRRCGSLKVDVAGRHIRFRVTGDSWATYIPTKCIKEPATLTYCSLISPLQSSGSTKYEFLSKLQYGKIKCL